MNNILKLRTFILTNMCTHTAKIEGIFSDTADGFRAHRQIYDNLNTHIMMYEDAKLSKKERRKSLTRWHVKDIGSAGGIQSYGGRGTKGLWPGSAFVTSRYLHLYVMAVLSGARVVRALLV